MLCSRLYSLQTRTMKSLGWMWLLFILNLYPVFTAETCPGSTGCDSLPNPAEGARTGDNTCTGNTISFQCNDGFLLHGSSKRQCQENGQWSGMNVTCVERGNYWEYIKQEYNPLKWPTHYPKCGGDKQSPINIVTSDVLVNETLFGKSLQLKNFDSLLKTKFTNTGKSPTVLLDEKDGGNVPQITGGPLGDDTYTMLQFHLHYGSTGKAGSEHTLNGKEYAGELHMVHWNSDKYGNADNATSSPKGLAVVGVMVQVGDALPEFEKLSNQVEGVKYKGFSTSMANINVSAFLPASLDYYTYGGSLTTPPCYETVTWILLKEPISVSNDQLDAFRTILRTKNSSDDVELMQNNYRPPQSLNGRSVYLVSSSRAYKAAIFGGGVIVMTMYCVLKSLL
eukprot:m.39771 g.39771  ORF g.39771 m.39771 type:complete len:394 (+) comp32811_c0_seq1:114-1295(+)